MAVLKLSGEEYSGLADRCASLTAANIERFKASYPNFTADEDSKNRYPAENRYPSALLDCTRGAHEVVGESIVKRIFEEAEELTLKPRVLIYCNDVPKEEIARCIPGCELDFAFDDREAIQKMRETDFDGIILGFWDTKTKAFGGNKSIHVLYLDAGDRDHYIIGEHHPDCRKALLALPGYQVDYAEKFVFNFMIDKPLKRSLGLHTRFISDRIKNGLLDFEKRVKEILRGSITFDADGNPDGSALLFYCKLLSIYGVKEQSKPEEPTHTVDGRKLLQSIRRKTAMYSVPTENP